MSSGLIDVHHHVIPAVYRAAIEVATDGTVGGIPQPAWSEDAMRSRIEALGVERAVVSISAPALEPVAAEERAGVARQCNDAIAALAAWHGDAVGGFAVLPMPDVAASVVEVGRALDELHLDGVALLTNYGGRYLGDRVFAPLLEELDRRAAVVHVHPNLPPPMPDAHLLLPPPVLEFTFDTTRMVAEMILSETLQKYSRMTLVLSHLGGTLPWMAWRLSMLDSFPSASGGAREPVREQLRRMYYDVALSADSATLRLATDVVGADRLLYGSDFPFAPDDFIDRNTANMAGELGAATRDNGARLFGGG